MSTRGWTRFMVGVGLMALIASGVLSDLRDPGRHRRSQDP